MKNLLIKILIIFAFTILGFSASAKSNDPELNLDTRIKKVDDREDLHKFDFDKLFSDAEKYYKDAKAWKKIKCEPKSGFICTKHECKEREAGGFIILDKENNMVKRCENKVCEEFGARFDQTGVFINIQAEGPVGTLIRVLGDYRYKEIATVALDAYINNGECVVFDE